MRTGFAGDPGPAGERRPSLRICWFWRTRGGRRDCASSAEVIFLCRSVMSLGRGCLVQWGLASGAQICRLFCLETGPLGVGGLACLFLDVRFVLYPGRNAVFVRWEGNLCTRVTKDVRGRDLSLGWWKGALSGLHVVARNDESEDKDGQGRLLMVKLVLQLRSGGEGGGGHVRTYKLM